MQGVYADVMRVRRPVRARILSMPTQGFVRCATCTLGSAVPRLRRFSFGVALLSGVPLGSPGSNV